MRVGATAHSYDKLLVQTLLKQDEQGGLINGMRLNIDLPS